MTWHPAGVRGDTSSSRTTSDRKPGKSVIVASRIDRSKKMRAEHTCHMPLTTPTGADYNSRHETKQG